LRFLLDESADARLAAMLAADGHDVTSIIREHRPGMSDIEVLELANSERRILITDDRDFGELIVRRGLEHAGVILFRLQSTRLAAKRAAMDRVLRDYSDNLSDFLVVTERGVRVRRS
jgi:predicted nuclease of predicted toxin-antitoxin system